jgi:hypothetical protein
MTRALKLLVFPLASLLFCSLGNAADPALSQNEVKLVGTWQEGMTSRFAKANAEQLRMAKRVGLLGAVVQYNADHTFAMYPPCGAKRDDLRKAGFDSMTGKWQLTEAGDLLVTVEAKGQSFPIESRLTWKDDQLIVTAKHGNAVSKSGPYVGPLPPSC